MVEEVGEEHDEGEGVDDDDVVEELRELARVSVVDVHQSVQQHNHELRLQKLGKYTVICRRDDWACHKYLGHRVNTRLNSPITLFIVPKQTI